MPPTIKAPYRSERAALGKRVHEFVPRTMPLPLPLHDTLICLDTFAGAGGFSTALMRAAREYNFKVDLTMVNHSARALDNAVYNLGRVNVYNSAIQDLDPLEVVPGGYLDLLLSSPECIYFSSARGAKPINDQRRSTFAEILRFLETLYVDTFVLENVEEAINWGPLDEHKRPIPGRKGEYFKKFLRVLKRLGYDVTYQKITSADLGDPTTRRRLYLCAQRRRKATLPEQTHSKNGTVPGTQCWVPARKIIDFAIKGLSIFDRAEPHVPKTLRRIGIGFDDQTESSPLAYPYVESVERFKGVAEIYFKQIAHVPTEKKLGRKLTRDERRGVKTVKVAAQQQHRILVEEVFRTPVAIMTWEDLLRDRPAPTVDGAQSLTLGTIAAVDPVITKLYGTTTTANPKLPLDTVTAGGINFALASPVPETFIVTVNHGDKTDRARRPDSLDNPIKTQATKGSQGVVSAEISTPAHETTIPLPERFLVSQHYGFDNANRALSEPALGMTTSGAGYIATPDARRVEPVIIARYNPRVGDRRPHSLRYPAPTATGSGAGYLASPELRAVADRLGSAVAPTIVNMKGKSTGTQTSVPAPTQTAHAPHLYLASTTVTPVEPVIIPQQRGKGVDADQLTRPLRTIQTKNGTAIATPDQAIVLDGIRPGKPYIIVSGLAFELDILYRMLNCDELAKSMSLTTDTETYRFRKGTPTSAAVKMIGNAVACETARKVIICAMRHRFEQRAQVAA